MHDCHGVSLCRIVVHYGCKSVDHHKTLPALPTRRSSDLTCRQMLFRMYFKRPADKCSSHLNRPCTLDPMQASGRLPSARQLSRSEEHTSELQSLTKRVCRLLLEKKKRRHSGTRKHERSHD